MRDVRLLGHAVHPMLVVFPLGLLTTSVLFDIIHYASGDLLWSTIAFWTIAVGLVGGIAAAVVGLIDWFAIPSGTRAKRVGLNHAIVNATVLALFAASWFLRLPADEAQRAPGGLAFVLSLIGLAFSLVGGWLGGELVEQYGMSVNKNANSNAPSSLSR